MTSTKYIGMDVHAESISMAVRNSVGKVVMESVIETKASMILQFIEGLRGDLHVTFEEGTAAAWLYDLLKPHVARLVVCNPRRNALLKVGNKSDRIDARKLSELLRGNQLHPVYHQAAVVEYQWFCDRDAQQRRSPPCQRATAKGEEASVHSRPEPKPQSRSEESV